MPSSVWSNQAVPGKWNCQSIYFKDQERSQSSLFLFMLLHKLVLPLMEHFVGLTIPDFTVQAEGHVNSWLGIRHEPRLQAQRPDRSLFSDHEVDTRGLSSVALQVASTCKKNPSYRLYALDWFKWLFKQVEAPRTKDQKVNVESPPGICVIVENPLVYLKLGKVISPSKKTVYTVHWTHEPV